MLPVSVIIVTFNSGHCLPETLRSIPGGAEVIVVDNGSTDESIAHAEAHGSRIVANGANLGFGRGCNIGAEAASRTWLLFLNPDAVLLAGALEALLASARRHKRASAFSPRQLRTIASDEGVDTIADREMPMLSGAAFFVSKANFDAVEGFDENIFLYFEDEDLSIRLQKAFGSTIQVGNAVVRHVPGTGSQLTLKQRFDKYRHYGRSRVYFCRKHHKPFNAYREALKQGAKALLRVITLHPVYAAQHLGRCMGYLSGEIRPDK